MVVAATIAENLAGSGAGVYGGSVTISSLTFHYTLLANNPGDNCAGEVSSLGYNLASDSSCTAFTQPGDQHGVALPLGSLLNNGGPTLTHLPLDDNPAIDAIPLDDCLVVDDQRGMIRP